MTLQNSGLGLQDGDVPGIGPQEGGCVEIYRQKDAGKGAGPPDPRGSRCILPDPGDCLSDGQFEESYSVFRDFQNSEEQRNLERPA